MSDAFLDALSIALILAPCSLAALSSKALNICIVKFRGSSSSSISLSPGSNSKKVLSFFVVSESFSGISIGTICCSVGICDITDLNLL